MITAGAEIRDLAMAGRVELNQAGRATGVHYVRKRNWHFHRARHVAVAGYAIETPRLLLNSATARHPDGLANGSGLVGKNLMTQSNQAVFGKMDEAVRWNKGPPSLTITEHWNYEDKGKDYFGGDCWMGQGPLPIEWASIQTDARGLWGSALRDEMLDYNYKVGVKMVGEMMPNEANRVTLSDEVDQYGIRIPRIAYSWGENDRKLINHALAQMQISKRMAECSATRQSSLSCRAKREFPMVRRWTSPDSMGVRSMEVGNYIDMHRTADSIRSLTCRLASERCAVLQGVISRNSTLPAREKN